MVLYLISDRFYPSGPRTLAVEMWGPLKKPLYYANFVHFRTPPLRKRTFKMTVHPTRELGHTLDFQYVCTRNYKKPSRNDFGGSFRIMAFRTGVPVEKKPLKCLNSL
jgi:hypothetical protein